MGRRRVPTGQGFAIEEKSRTWPQGTKTLKKVVELTDAVTKVKSTKSELDEDS
jgi:hypothetical protein